MTTRLTIVLAAALALAGCGGGGGEQGPGIQPANVVQTLTGSGSPSETIADQRARSAELYARTDSFIVSTTHGETSSPSLPKFRVNAECSGTTCRFYIPQTEYEVSQDLDDIVAVDAKSSQAVLSKHGITTNYHQLDANAAYGSVMNHSAFTVQTGRGAIGNVTLWSRGSIAAGDLTGTRPSGSAAWRGVMVGVPTDASGRTDFLQGDAELTYEFSGSLDATFSQIKNITRNQVHSEQTVRFSDVSVASDGTYEAGLAGNRIQGGFYGPGHTETAGVFEQSGIVGSFGAKR